MQHFITLLLGKIALTLPGGVWDTPSRSRWDGVSLQNAVVDMLVTCALNST